MIVSPAAGIVEMGLYPVALRSSPPTQRRVAEGRVDQRPSVLRLGVCAPVYQAVGVVHHHVVAVGVAHRVQRVYSTP